MRATRPLLPWLLVPALPLLVPLLAMRFTPEVNWTGFDFVAAYGLFAGAGLTYRFVTSGSADAAYRAAAALAVLGGLALIWVNLAVGFIGDEDNPANLLYGGVLGVGALGAVLAGLEPRGMARTLFAVAATQFLVPIVAWLVWRPNFDSGVAKIFLLNFAWVLLFTVSGLLFGRAARRSAARD